MILGNSSLHQLSYYHTVVLQKKPQHRIQRLPPSLHRKQMGTRPSPSLWRRPSPGAGIAFPIRGQHTGP